ncbi:PDZ domain-containing protein [Thalassotalea sp. PP2-459]|uniref:PDZ domain-containing protein n=1 Tax=Thalassotalea sp. PP2-459 TaxID=1742724 RepID=UPI000943843F|nr:PDZ domain-containing protein [Thalassotalea sp. PP2-459]OKY26979.1 hypothetical protein BI291_10695 [Thalassotalea sp. PP2-459]
MKLWLLFFIVFSQFTLAENILKRTSFLGFVPESTQSGEVVVHQLHPQGTAHALGLRVGDKLISINGNVISDFSNLLTELGKIYEGDTITLSISRDTSSLILEAKAQGKPKEKGKGYQVNYGEFSWQHETIRTITYLPEKPRQDGAAVLFIQGYTCSSIDYGMLPDMSLNQLLGQFSQSGFTVMKMEKPGVGDSEGQLDCQLYDFVTENKAFLAGLSHLKTKNGVSAKNVFVFGHSLGVLHSAIIAEQGLAKGVIGYGGVFKPWIEYLHDIYEKQSVLYWGVTKEQAKKNVKLISPFLTKWLDSDLSWQEVIASKVAKRVIDAELIAINEELIMNRHYNFFRSINRFNFAALWQKSKSHGLMLHGMYDIQAIDGKWAKNIVSLLNQNEGVTGQELTFERTDHSMLKFINSSDLMKFTRREVTDVGKFNQKIASSSISWMESILSL